MRWHLSLLVTRNSQVLYSLSVCSCYLHLLVIASIFGHEGDAASDIVYINWLNMVRAGLLALEFYSPETQNWRQAIAE